MKKFFCLLVLLALPVNAEVTYQDLLKPAARQLAYLFG